MKQWIVAGCHLVGVVAVAVAAITGARSTAAQEHEPLYLDAAHPVRQLTSAETAAVLQPAAVSATCVDPPPGVAIALGSSPAGGYLPLSAFGVAPVAGVGDDTITSFAVPSYRFAGETWSSLGFSSNGYVVVGPSDNADSTFVNQNLPNAGRPNNVLAAFWTDLNPSTAGALRIGILTDGADTWIVLDWEAVREFSQVKLNSFEVWIGIGTDAHPGEDVTFVYGTLQGTGDAGLLTVGAENRYGNRGQNWYLNGVGTLPSAGTQLRVTSSPYQCAFLPLVKK